MCLALIALDCHPLYRLIVVMNRDEYYDRPTQTAHWWEGPPHILAGKDLRSGGTWFGVDRHGRVAFLTNFTDPSSYRENAPSRGILVKNFFDGHRSPEKYLFSTSQRGEMYNGFNLLVGDSSQLHYYSNRSGKTKKLTSGIYGLSNHFLDTPWPKVVRGKEKLTNLLQQPSPSVVHFFEILSDRSAHTNSPPFCKPCLPAGREGPGEVDLCVVTPKYGTRFSTVLLISRERHIQFIEQQLDEQGFLSGEVKYEFEDDPPWDRRRNCRLQML